MKKIICKKEYDTENAELLKKHTEGVFGEPEGYEESLYQISTGTYFLYVNGGENSPYPKEDIRVLRECSCAFFPYLQFLWVASVWPGCPFKIS